MWLGFLTHLLLQMVDKLWYDWQNANPANFWAFGGGSVSVTQNLVPNREFPVGIPPYMNVRNQLASFFFFFFFRLTKILVVLDADPDGRHHERVHHLRADGHSTREVVLHLRVSSPD